MDAAGDFPEAQHQDRPLDQPPAAEVDQIAEAAAAIGARCGLARGMLAEQGNEIGRVVECGAVGDMDVMQGKS